jgi:hypothetical protein
MHTPTQSLLLLAALITGAGCATEAGPKFIGAERAPGVAAELDLQPPQHGFQAETLGIMIEPGEDIRWCEVLRAPGDPTMVYSVDRIETAMTAHGQDLIVSAAPPDSETGSVMDVGSRVPCTRAGEAFGEELVEVTSTQLGYHDERYPRGVGQVFYGGQKIALDYHYVNDGEEPLPAKVKVNFHVVDASAVQHLARTAAFNNLTIYTPPGGRSSHLAECTVSQELLVGELVRRTQSRGTGFAVWLSGGEHDGQLLWYSPNPTDSRLKLPEPLRLRPGEGFRFQCDYRNTTALELRYGVNATDEMCMLDAKYWLADELSAAETQGCLLLEVGPDGVARK